MLKWKKLNIVYCEWDEEEDLESRSIEESETLEQCKVPFVVKLKDGKKFVVGDVNKNLGRCECCSIFSLRDIEEFANIEIEL
jgi:hypothetical protein